MKKVKKKFRTMKVLEEDYLKVKKWSAIRDIKIYEVIHLMVEPKDITK